MISTKFKPDWQQVLFYSVALLIILIPVWSVEWFHTGDMPAHLYCANVFNQLLFNDHSVYHQFFELNIRPVPNSIVQVLLSFFLILFSPALTIKIVTTIVILVFCLGYLLVVKQLTGNKNLSVLLIFTIVFNYPLIMGFYSFIMSLGMMMISIAFYLNKCNDWNNKKYLVFSTLLLLTWFSHFFGFAATLLFVFINETVGVVKSIREKAFNLQCKKILLLFFCIVPVLALTVLFANKAAGATEIKFLDMDDLLERLKTITPLITYNNDFEKYNITAIELIVVALIIAGLIYKSLQIESKSRVALTCMIITCTILYFVLPYEFFAGGYINIRMLLVLILFIMIMVDCIQLNRTLNSIKTVAILIVCISASYTQLNASKAYSIELAEMYSGIYYINNNSVVLPIGYTENWLHYDFPLYLSVEKNVVVLDNNEALSPNSLVRWKSADVFSNMGTCGKSNRPLFELKKYEERKLFRVDYIIRWQWQQELTDSATIITNREIANSFTLIYLSSGKKMEVFKRRSTGS